jgi:dienelactone hydrolase
MSSHPAPPGPVDADRASRRTLLLAGAACAAATLAACTSDDPRALGTPTAAGAPVTLPLTPQQAALGNGDFALFGQTDLNFQTLFALGASGQIAVAGEVAAVVAQANSTAGGATYQAVYDAFVAMGNRLETSATESLRAGRRVTARSRFLRAAKYYAQALYWVLGTSTPDAEAATYTAMDNSFVAALDLMDPRPEPLTVPYGGRTLPAWFLRPSDDGKARPTIIINNGSDGQNVDLLVQGGFDALDRGYNVVIFEGPGQGSQLFLHNIPFRHDWEHVITPIIDVLAARPDVDDRRIALRGISFGGELCPRAAAFEPRLAALIADPGSTSSWLDYPKVVRDTAVGPPEQVNQAWADLIIPGATPQQLFAIKKTLEIFSAEAHDQVKAGGYPTDWAALSTEIQKYDLAGIAERITCPTLVTQYEGDTAFGDEPEQLYAMLRTKKKDLVRFTAVDGAQYHCGPMAPQVSNEACWDWLDEVFER